MQNKYEWCFFPFNLVNADWYKYGYTALNTPFKQMGCKVGTGEKTHLPL